MTLIAFCDENRTTRHYESLDGLDFSAEELHNAFPDAKTVYMQVLDEARSDNNGSKYYRYASALSQEVVGRICVVDSKGTHFYDSAQIIEKIINFRESKIAAQEDLMQSLEDIEPLLQADNDTQEVSARSSGPARLLIDILSRIHEDDLPKGFFENLRNSDDIKITPFESFSESSETFKNATEVHANPVGRLHRHLRDVFEKTSPETKGKFSKSLSLALSLAASAHALVASPSITPSPTTETARNDEEKVAGPVCTTAAGPDRLEVRLKLWKESAFYKEMVETKQFHRIDWVEGAAKAAQDLWKEKKAHFKKAGFESPDHIFMVTARFAMIESYGNQSPTNALNPEVLGPHHIALDTFHGVLEQHPWLEKLSHWGDDVKIGERLREDGYISTAVAATLVADDYLRLKKKFGMSPEKYAPGAYTPYLPHVSGYPLASQMMKAIKDKDMKLVNGTKMVEQTAIDVAGRGVAEDNPSLFHKWVRIEVNGNIAEVRLKMTEREKLARFKSIYGVELSPRDRLVRIPSKFGDTYRGYSDVKEQSYETTEKRWGFSKIDGVLEVQDVKVPHHVLKIKIDNSPSEYTGELKHRFMDGNARIREEIPLSADVSRLVREQTPLPICIPRAG